jgi:hypothetical protein
MPIDKSRKLLFIHIPKTGGTTVEKILGLYEPWPAVRMDILRGPYQRDDEELRLQHLPFEDVVALTGLDFSSWYKFAFVRNPWDRLVSSFCFEHKEQRKKNSFVETEVFPKYVDWVETVVSSRKGLVGEHCHLRPQLEFSLNKLDFLGRFERFEPDLRVILKRLGISVDGIPHLHKSKKRKHYAEYYDERTKQKVAEIYAEDIEDLGYSFGA